MTVVQFSTGLRATDSHAGSPDSEGGEELLDAGFGGYKLDVENYIRYLWASALVLDRQPPPSLGCSSGRPATPRVGEFEVKNGCPRHYPTIIDS